MNLVKSGRIIISICLIIFSILVNYFLNTLKKQKDCPCNKGWRITNGVIISNFFLLANLINLILPVNKVFSGIPLLGSIYMGIYGLLIFLLLYIISSISNELKTEKCKSCNLDSIQILYSVFKDSEIKNCIYATIILVVISFWL